MFEEHLQNIAEQLARDLQRSVIIDDVALRPLAISPQTGKLDRSRVEAVLQRRTSARLRRKLTEHGVFSAREPVSIPGDPQRVTLPRLCLPLLAEDQLLGFLWLIDEPALTAEQTRLAQAAVAQAADLLAQRAIRAADQFAVLSDLADALLNAQEQVRQQAAGMLAGQAALAGTPPYTLAVICPVADPRSPHHAPAGRRGHCTGRRRTCAFGWRQAPWCWPAPARANWPRSPPLARWPRYAGRFARCPDRNWPWAPAPAAGR